MKKLLLFTLLASSFSLSAQTWTLWASGLPAGSFPRLTVAPNHDIYYTLLGQANSPGIVYKANTTTATGSFTGLPPVPFPASHQNNINAIIANDSSELIAGIMRNTITEPWIFKFNTTTQSWDTASCTNPPTLGAYCITKSPLTGTIFIGAKWSNVYKSTDGGNSFVAIDETSLIQPNYPCYYPSWTGTGYDAAIYGINVDGNGRLYAGTESAGVVFSNDEGLSWQPADYFACQTANPNWKDSNSVMKPLSYGGNCGGIGFTANNNLVWTGANMWTFNWPNTLGCADMNAHTVTPAAGLPSYINQVGQAVTKIVTAPNGQLFLHCGDNTHGIYTSMDGINWTQFNTGITGLNDGQSQGGFAVDGYSVFFATHDGKIWRYDIPLPTSVNETTADFSVNAFPVPADDRLSVEISSSGNDPGTISLYDMSGRKMDGQQTDISDSRTDIDIAGLATGCYLLSVENSSGKYTQRVIVTHAN